MARAVFINAILNGKLGGTVYANNKGGAYVRTHVIPTNPRTQQQTKTRANFSNSSKLWGTLDAGQKAAWDSYAVSFFSPKRRKIGVTYSGFSAFQSLNNSFAQASAATRVAKLTAPTGITLTKAWGTTPSTAITGLFGGNITDASHNIYTQTLGACTLNTAASFSAIIQFSANLPTAGPVFTDTGSGRKVGYVFYGNLPNKVNPSDTICLGSCPPISGVSGWSGSHNAMTLVFEDGDFDLNTRKIWYAEGNTLIVTGYAISEAGEFALIGSSQVTVAAP